MSPKIDQTQFPIFVVNRMVDYSGTPAFDTNTLPYPDLQVTYTIEETTAPQTNNLEA